MGRFNGKENFPMDVKDFFQAIREIDKQINGKLEQLERLEALATKVTSAMSEAGSRPSGNSRSVENNVDKIIQLRKEINAEIDQFVDMKRTANEIISRIQNQRYRCVLEKRYLLGKTWETIAEELGVAYQSACRINGRALQEAEKIFQNLEEGDRK